MSSAACPDCGRLVIDFDVDVIDLGSSDFRFSPGFNRPNSQNADDFFGDVYSRKMCAGTRGPSFFVASLSGKEYPVSHWFAQIAAKVNSAGRGGRVCAQWPGIFTPASGGPFDKLFFDVVSENVFQLAKGEVHCNGNTGLFQFAAKVPADQPKREVCGGKIEKK